MQVLEIRVREQLFVGQSFILFTRFIYSRMGNNMKKSLSDFKLYDINTTQQIIQTQQIIHFLQIQR